MLAFSIVSWRLALSVVCILACPSTFCLANRMRIARDTS